MQPSAPCTLLATQEQYASPPKFHSELNKDNVTQGPKIHRNWDMQTLKLAFTHLQKYYLLTSVLIETIPGGWGGGGGGGGGGVCCYEYH